MDLLLKILLYILAAPFVFAGVVIGGVLLVIAVLALVLFGLLVAAFSGGRRDRPAATSGWRTARWHRPQRPAGSRSPVSPGPSGADLTASDGVTWEVVDEPGDGAAHGQCCPECMGTGVGGEGDACATCGGEGRVGAD